MEMFEFTLRNVKVIWQESILEWFIVSHQYFVCLLLCAITLKALRGCCKSFILRCFSKSTGKWVWNWHNVPLLTSKKYKCENIIQCIFFKCLNRTPQTKRNTCVAVYLYGKLSRAEFYNYVYRQKIGGKIMLFPPPFQCILVLCNEPFNRISNNRLPLT